jgi:wyosine [tRNA(Phe)-imidazoG37] synthetase (radical SAM superfamily)
MLQTQQRIEHYVFGPYDSRRFGRSLAINPLPWGARLCNFDCIYCECAGSSWPLEWDLRPQLPTPVEIHDELRTATEHFSADELDSIMITGNGEPTLSPCLNGIVDVVNAARDRDWPRARTVILSNGSTCHKPAVRAAVAKLDERIVKLDAGNNWILDQLNRPAGRLSIAELVRRISAMPDIVIQSMFVHGPIDNTGPRELEAWGDRLARLKPTSVQIYSLDRLPAKDWVRRVPLQKLESIAEYVESTLGIAAHVF